jgi:transforming growth factor-beta-induced protein
MKSVNLSFFKFMLFMGVVILGVSSCKDDDDDDNNNPPKQETIADIAVNTPRFSILVDALTRTNLVSVVADENANLTVFAPNNDAFTNALIALGLADLDALEAALGTDGLRNVLLYHVLGAEVKAADVTTGYVATQATNADGDNLSIYINTSMGVMINGSSSVENADIDASNGVIHEIDAVILPLSIAGLLAVNPEYSSLVAALGVADGNLDSVLSDPATGPVTVFAPNDQAFGQLLSALMLNNLNELVNLIGTGVLSEVLLYHVVAGNITSDEVMDGAVTTLQGSDFTISTAGGVTITDGGGTTTNVISFDIQGTNGVAHGLDYVLLPQ